MTRRAGGLMVSELFGPTVQGEGPSAGQLASFARLSAALQAAYGLDPVWVMPEGTTSAAVLGGMRLLADEVIARGWHLSPRLHVLLWEDVRGR